jgi:DNA-binding CsgD family transcriptional regulator
MSVSTSPSDVLTPLERHYILLTQNGLPIVAKPYHWIAEQLDISVNTSKSNLARAKQKLKRLLKSTADYKLKNQGNG